MLKRSIVALAVAVFVLVGCGTTIPISVTRPPTMDTSSINRIAIMPFETSDNSALQQEAAKTIAQTASDKFQGLTTKTFTLVSPSEIQRLRSSGESIENHVDALFGGQIISLNVKNGSRTVERKDKDGNKYNVTIYDKEMEMVFTYNFMRARDGSLVGSVRKMGRDSSSSENRGDLRSDTAMLTRIINSRFADLPKDVAPYTVRENRALMPEKAKTYSKADQKMLLAKMKNAETLLKQGSYKQSLNAYLNTYDQYGNIAAAYNATILYEVLGDLPEAFGLIEFVYDDTGNPKAGEMKNRLAKIMADNELLAVKYQKGAATAREKVTQLASSEILKAVPKGTKVWVFNNSQDERSLTDSIIDNIASDLTKGGIILVDRNNSKLMDMEQRFQMSGAVSDSDFVSIGNAAGASVLITIGVTGTSSLRRLQVQIMDMEKRTYTFRSGSGDEWKI